MPLKAPVLDLRGGYSPIPPPPGGRGEYQVEWKSGEAFQASKRGKEKNGEKSGEGFQNWGGKDFKLGWGIYTPDGIEAFHVTSQIAAPP